MSLLKANLIEHPLRPGWRAASFLAGLGLLAIILVGGSVRLWLSESFATSFTPDSLGWALYFDSSDPRIQKLAGLYYSYLTPPDMVEGLKHLRKATELNPLGSIYWSALASACGLAGDNTCADQAFERATSLSPVVPQFQWAAANHYLITDQKEKAFSHFRRLLELDPGYGGQTFRVCLRYTDDADLVYREVLPPQGNSEVKLSYINYLSYEGKADAAYRAWVQAAASPSPFPITAAEPYLDHLIALGRGDEARGVWRDLQKFGLVGRSESDDGQNLIYNGDFEQTPLNAGLDWRLSDAPYLIVDFADSHAYHGTHCLHLNFTVSRNDEFVGAYQFVPVAPNRTYLLQAFVRSQDITSDSGPRLRVIDPSCPSCVNLMSETTVGTTPWHEVSLQFVSGAQTQLVNVAVVRPRSRAFPTEITGNFWLDDVTMEALSASRDKVASAPVQ